MCGEIARNFAFLRRHRHLARVRVEATLAILNQVASAAVSDRAGFRDVAFRLSRGIRDPC